MKELNAKIEQIDKKKWRALVGSTDDIHSKYWKDSGKVVVFYGKTEKSVMNKTNAYTDQKTTKHARKEAAYTVELTRGLLESAEQKNTSERIKELKHKKNDEGLTSKEFADLQGLVS